MGKNAGKKLLIPSILKYDDNLDAIEELRDYFTKEPPNIVPFVGAGMSIPSGFKSWHDFLMSGDWNMNRKTRQTVVSLLKQGEYEYAASALEKTMFEKSPRQGRAAFCRRVSKMFGKASNRKKYDTIKGAVTYLPQLTGGPLITSNVDYVLETVYRLQRPHIVTKVGATILEHLKGSGGSTPYLWKLHGNAGRYSTLILTHEDYEKAYGKRSEKKAMSYPGLGDALLSVLGMRAILFLGCSLDKDRICDLLLSIGKKMDDPRFYAVVPATEYCGKAFDDRWTQLTDLGVTPIWYQHGQHAQVARLLKDLVAHRKRAPRSITESESPTDGTPEVNRGKKIDRRFKPTGENKTAASRRSTSGKKAPKKPKPRKVNKPSRLKAKLHNDAPKSALFMKGHDPIKIVVSKFVVLEPFDNGNLEKTGEVLVDQMDRFRDMIKHMFRQPQDGSKGDTTPSYLEEFRPRIVIAPGKDRLWTNQVITDGEFTRDECDRIIEAWGFDFKSLPTLREYRDNEFHFAITELLMKNPYDNENDNGILPQLQLKNGSQSVEIPGRHAVFTVNKRYTDKTLLGYTEKDAGKQAIGARELYCDARTGVFLLRNLFRALTGVNGWKLHPADSDNPIESRCLMSNPGSTPKSVLRWISIGDYAFCPTCISVWEDANCASDDKDKKALLAQLQRAAMVLKGMTFSRLEYM